MSRLQPILAPPLAGPTPPSLLPQVLPLFCRRSWWFCSCRQVKLAMAEVRMFVFVCVHCFVCCVYLDEPGFMRCLLRHNFQVPLTCMWGFAHMLLIRQRNLMDVQPCMPVDGHIYMRNFALAWQQQPCAALMGRFLHNSSAKLSFLVLVMPAFISMLDGEWCSSHLVS